MLAPFAATILPGEANTQAVDAITEVYDPTRQGEVDVADAE